MNEKTETRPQEEMTVQAEVITDYYAKRWYNEGFRFAINYIYVHMVNSGDPRVDPEAFKAYLFDTLDIGVEEDYFEKHPFNSGRYPSGQCPGDIPGTCIPCADNGIVPIDTIPSRR